MLPGPGRRPVAVEHLGLVLVPGGRRPVRVDDQGPAPAVDRDLVVEPAQKHAVLDRSSCRRWPCAWCGAPGTPRRAGRTARPTGSAYRAASPRCGSRPGRSRRTRCPAAGSARPAARRAAGGAGSDASPPGPDSRSTALPITACSSAAQAASRAPSRRPSSSTHSRTRSSSASTLTSPVTIGAIAASQAMPSAASPSSQAPSFAPVSDAAARCAAHRGPDLRGPLLLQRRAAVQQEQVRQGDVRPDLHRLPGPLRQQVGRDQAAHRLGQRVVVPLLLGPVIVRSRPGRTARPAPCATTAAHSGVRSPVITPAPWNVVSSRTPTVGEPALRVLIGQVGRGPARTSPRTARTGPPAPARPPRP